ncbi:MAG: DUF7246 family protein [Acidimicrobiales bacterium]
MSLSNDDRPRGRVGRRDRSPAALAAEKAAAHLERKAEWAGVRAGDRVEIAGNRARSATWSFLAHVRNVRTGDEWVEVVGGRAGSRAVRSFRPESVFAPSPRGSRGPRAAPLTEVPRLPL